MKKAVVILSVIFAGFLLSVIVQSCDNPGYPADEEMMTKADVLVASPEFQVLSEETMTLSEEIKTNYLRLPKKQRQEFIEINQEILEGKANDKELEVLWDKLSSIIQIDYKARTKKITDLATLAYGNHNVPTRELLIAMEKRKINNRVTITRLKTRSESGGSYQDCLDGCTKTYNGAISVCLSNHKQAVDNGRDDTAEHKLCISNATANLNQCNADCLKYLPVG